MTLTALEVVLSVDNLVVIAILVGARKIQGPPSVAVRETLRALQMLETGFGPPTTSIL